MRLHYLQHVAFETPGYILDWAKDNTTEVTSTHFYKDGYALPNQDDIDCLVVMGGPMGVYDKDQYPWLEPEQKFIQETIKLDKPVLGICLGAQLIAAALGAKVYKGTKEIGWFPIQKINKGLFLKDLPETLNVMHWHGDTFYLPENAVLLASNDVTKHQAFEYKNCVALQFHFEMGPDNIQVILENAANDLTDDPYVQSAKNIELEMRFFADNKNYLFSILDHLAEVA